MVLALLSHDRTIIAAFLTLIVFPFRYRRRLITWICDYAAA
jgi:hypothetical protein